MVSSASEASFSTVSWSAVSDVRVGNGINESGWKLRPKYDGKPECPVK